ncbi:ATP-binding protein [Parafannyhessea sp. LCP19S3_B1]|uniref:ATP-binding protein n=1 Tax=Parafannyhessea sp. LCP19S3_B1 TaxID=3438795 RepID=UPI003F9AA1CA
MVLVRKPDRIIASNPGTLRIAVDEVEAGGVSDPRNEMLLSMFSLLNIGERAGSGYDTLREGTYSAGKPDPLLEELWEPDRVRLTLELETSGLADFRLPGMGGESSSLVTKVEPPRSDQVQ